MAADREEKFSLQLDSFWKDFVVKKSNYYVTKISYPILKKKKKQLAKHRMEAYMKVSRLHFSPIKVLVSKVRMSSFFFAFYHIFSVIKFLHFFSQFTLLFLNEHRFRADMRAKPNIQRARTSTYIERNN